MAVAPAASAESLVWEFDRQREIIGTANMLPGQIAQVHLPGQVDWVLDTAPSGNKTQLRRATAAGVSRSNFIFRGAEASPAVEPDRREK